MIVIRPAGHADADVIATLTTAVQTSYTAARPDVCRPATPDTFPAAIVRDLMAQPNRLFLVAVAGKTIVGHTYAEVQRQPVSAFEHAGSRL